MENRLTVSLSLEADIVEKLRKAADEESVSVSDLVNGIAARFLEEKQKKITPSGRDRRTFPRKTVHLAAVLELGDRGQGKTRIKGETQDISAGGIRVATRDAAKEDFLSGEGGNDFKVAMKLPDTDDDIVLNCSPTRIMKMDGTVQICASFDGMDYYELVKLFQYCGWKQPVSEPKTAPPEL